MCLITFSGGDGRGLGRGMYNSRYLTGHRIEGSCLHLGVAGSSLSVLLTSQLGGAGAGHSLTVKPLSLFSTFRQKDLVQKKDGVLCDMCEQVVKQLVSRIDSNKTEVHILWGAWPSSGAGVGVLSLVGLVQSGELCGSLQRSPGRDVGTPLCLSPPPLPIQVCAFCCCPALCGGGWIKGWFLLAP